MANVLYAQKLPVITFWTSRRNATVGMLLIPLLILAILYPAMVGGAETNHPNVGQFVDRVFHDATGDHKYVVFVPAGYSAAKKWPVILYLHGAQSRGTDGRSQLVNGLAPAIKLRLADFPFVVVFPQCEDVSGHMLGGWTDESDDAIRALKIFDSVEQEYSVDKGREILMGVSMGGCGVWDVASRTASRWQAIVPADALGKPEHVARLTKVPVWSFHSTGDEIISIERAREMVAGLRAAGGRAYLSEVSTEGHANAGVTLTQAALYEWLLNPKKEPKLDLTWKTPAGYLEGVEEELPFLPGAEISNAIQLRVCQDVLEAVAYAMPAKAAAQPMSGYLPGMRQTTKVGALPFEVSFSNIHYQGRLEQARIATAAPDKIILQLGLRYVTMTLTNLQVNGRLLISAKAGPMQIVIGHRAPVWLNIAIRPRIEDHQWKFDLAGVDFQIPENNWYVTEPNGVQMRGMQFLSGRISEGLVEGIYGRKGEIEQKVRASVSGLMPQIEATANSYFAKMIPIGSVAIPVVQPRLKLWPESMSIDEHGLTVTLGTTIARLGQTGDDFKVRKYQSVTSTRVKSPAGVEIQISDQHLTAWTELITAGGVNKVHAMDFGLSEFSRLNDRELVQKLIPDLAQYGENLECNTEFALMKPLMLKTIASRELSSDLNQELSGGVALEVPRMKMIVTTRLVGERRWKPCVEIDYEVGHDYELNVLRGSYAARGVKIVETTDARIVADAKFAEGYVAQNTEIDVAGFTAQLLKAEEQTKQRMGGMSFPVNDIDVMGVPIRLEKVLRVDGHTVLGQQLPSIIVSNGTKEAMTYEVRGPFSSWGVTHKLLPGERQEFRVPYPLIWRGRQTSAETTHTLPIGQEVSYRDRPTRGLFLLQDKLKKEPAPAASAKADTTSVVK